MKKIKIYFYLTTALFFITVGMVAFYVVANWFDKNQIIFHSPIEISFFTPVKITSRLAEIKYRLIVEQTQLSDTPPANTDITKWSYLTKQKYAPLLAYIWKMESNRGTDLNQASLDNYCRSKGQTNEFGYGGMQSMKCFQTFAESVQAVIKTLDTYGHISNLARLCEYNMGRVTESCDYVTNWN